MNIYLYRGTGAYTLDALGVRHTSSQTDHDVTFSRSCDQGKIAKKLEKYSWTSHLFSEPNFKTITVGVLIV